MVVGAAAAAHKDVILGGVGYGSYLEGDVGGGDLVALGSEFGDLRVRVELGVRFVEKR